MSQFQISNQNTVMYFSKLKGREKRILILGKVGAGKSAVGNAILQRQNYFESCQRFRPVTRQLQSCSAIINGESYFVVDTPGVKGLKKNHEDAMRQLTRSVLATAPGFHCIVFVFSAMQRLEGCDIEIIKEFEELLGEHVYNHMIIVFTHVKQEELDGVLEDCTDIIALCKKCRNNYLSFGDGRDLNELKTQVNLFYERIGALLTRNNEDGHPHYIHNMYDRAYRILCSDAILIQRSKKITNEHALEEARQNALEGLSPNDAEMLALAKKYKCCTIL